MRVAIIVPSLANKGPVVVARDLVIHLKDKVEYLKVFYFDDIHEIKFSCDSEKISFLKKRDWSDFDIIHTHSLRPDAYVFLHKRGIKCKCVTTLHNYMKEDLSFTYNKLISFFFSRLWLLVLSKHDRIVGLSEHMVNYYSKWLPGEKLTFAYNGRVKKKARLEELSNTDFEKIRDLKKDRIVIGVFAGLTKRKGVHQLLDAAALDKNLGVLIIGQGPELEALKKQTERLFIQRQILFLGYRENVEDFFQFLDAYGMVSYSEGLPLVMLEAIQHNKVIVCSDTPLFKELFNNREVSFFELDNVESLLKAIKKAPEIDKNLAYNKAHVKFSAEAMSKRYFNIYQEIL
ncbi:glycosyltransferase family 4 protein [Marivirga tractuosa]|uniref:glycosyltransferase family 4 protein n=1 Tax=Marivirga tractuosa TaxID=1006 RepID=UPI0035CEFD9D